MGDPHSHPFLAPLQDLRLLSLEITQHSVTGMACTWSGPLQEQGWGCEVHWVAFRARPCPDPPPSAPPALPHLVDTSFLHHLN